MLAIQSSGACTSILTMASAIHASVLDSRTQVLHELPVLAKDFSLPIALVKLAIPRAVGLQYKTARGECKPLL